MRTCRNILSVSLAACALSLMVSAQGQTASAAKPTNKSNSKPTVLPYSIQVGRVDSKVEGVPAEFNAAIYENLIDTLNKSARFQQVLRDGDKRASGASGLIVLKTSIDKFQQGSETTRAVTTVGGATHVYVHMQAVGADGKSVAEKDVEGTVRFFGANLRATQSLASSMAKQLEVALAAQDAKN